MARTDPTIKTVPVGSVRPDPDNARRHGPRNLAAIKASLAEFGQPRPIIAWSGIIIAGNGTHAAAVELGWKKIRVLDVTDRIDEQQARAYALADNRIAELSEWDYPGLAAALRSLDEELRGLTGFADFELDPLLRAVWTSEQAARQVRYKVTNDQAEAIRAAIERVRKREADQDMSDGRCLELICADYLAGA